MRKRIFTATCILTICLLLAACGEVQDDTSQESSEPTKTETHELAPEAPEQKPMDYDSEGPEQATTAIWNSDNEVLYTSDGVVVCNDETDFTVTSVDGGLEISGCSARGQTVVIPSEIGGTPVVSIGSEAFCGKNYIRIYIGENVVHIASRAFAECPKLETICITGYLLSLDENAITGCMQLESIIIPGRVGFHADGKFISNCPSLRDVTLPYMDQPEALVDLDTCPNAVVDVFDSPLYEPEGED